MTRTALGVSCRFLAASLGAFILAAFPLHADESDLAQRILASGAKGEPIPMVSRMAPDIDLEGAYRVQRALVAARLESDAIAGFKAGLTGRLGRFWFGIDEPVMGVLLASGRRGDGAVIELAPWRRLILETEIMFIAGMRIDAPVADVAALKRLVRAVAAGMEIPEGGFREADVRNLEVTDIVAANVSAALVLVGAEVTPDGLDLSGITATLSRGGERLSEGSGSDAMGDPWKAALWLANAAVRRGYVIEPGQVLSTGVLGDRIEAEPGRYLADFGALGTLTFEMK